MLIDLYAGAIQDAQRRETSLPFPEVVRLAEAQPPARDALAALAPGDHMKVIAEVKRASPSRGPLADIPAPADLARQYEAGGASVISVLTEERKFKGSLDDLREVRAAVDLPILRKDFIATPYQVYEARAAGADLVLLIVAGLDRAQLTSLVSLTRELGMRPLIETHSAAELAIAAELGEPLVGVNARNLSTFELDRDLFGRVAHLIPESAVKIAESAVLSVEDVTRYRDAGATAVLVGEALVTHDPITTLESYTAVRTA